MKLLPMLLLNLATVGVALVVYDQMRGEGTPPSAGMEDTATDRTDVEQRLRALESARRPALQSAGTDPRLLARLDALEAELRQRAPENEASEVGRVPPPRPSPAPLGSPDEPSVDDVLRFRRLREAVRRADQMERSAKRVDRALDTLPLSLSPQQRRRIHEAYVAFQPRFNAMWGEAKSRARETVAAGGEVRRGEVLEQTAGRIQGAFAEALDDIVQPDDAESIARVLMPGGK